MLRSSVHRLRLNEKEKLSLPSPSVTTHVQLTHAEIS
jgi:hypothetical protein